ncbi:hypothetical protein EP7_004281 [Isosphaeraceae bacterium EP7]
MALTFLVNHAGVAADSIEVPTGATSAEEGFASKHIMTGPRSTGWRSTSGGSAGIGYAYDEDVAITHVVVARADWLLTKATQQVLGRQRDSSGAWSSIAGFNKNPLVRADLIGPRQQDLVVECSPADLRGIGILTGALTGSEATQVSKIYGSHGFSFSDADPSLGVATSTFEPGVRRKVMHGSMEYEVEKQFGLRFEGVAHAELVSFRAVANLFYWPFFLYDAEQAIWPWKLEHVILGGFSATPYVEGYWTLELSFFRLRHWD